jgi:hypothetical protein
MPLSLVEVVIGVHYEHGKPKPMPMDKKPTVGLLDGRNFIWLEKILV